MRDLLKKHGERLKLLKSLRMLYNEEYYKLFQINQFEYFRDKTDYLFVAYHKALTDVLTTFTFAGGLKIALQEPTQNETLSDVITETSLIEKLKAVAKNASIYGDGICQLVVSATDVELIVIDTEAWEPIPNPLGENYPPIGHAIIRKFQKSDKKDYYLIEAHYPGRIEYTAYTADMYQVDVLPLFTAELSGVTITPSLSTQSVLVEETGLDFPLVFQVRNEPEFSSVYSSSDYTLGSVSKVKKMNEILNQRQYVIRMHGNPKMIVPRALINQVVNEFNSTDEKAAAVADDLNFEDVNVAKKALANQRNASETYIAQEIMRKMEFLPDDSIDGSSSFKYIEYSGKLEESEKQYNLLKTQIDFECKMPRLISDGSIEIGSLSTESIKRLLSMTLAKVQDKREALTPTIKQIVYTIMQIKAVQTDYPSVNFGDPITPSTLEIIEENERMLNVGITSQRKAIATVHKTTDQEAEKLQAEIRGEQNIFVEPEPVTTDV